MNIVTIQNGSLFVEPKGIDKVWSLTRRIEVPLAHVRGATFDLGANHEPKGVRAPALSAPGKWSGTFVRDGEKTFWNVSTPGATIVIELADERFERLVLTVNEPRRLVDAINAAAANDGRETAGDAGGPAMRATPEGVQWAAVITYVAISFGLAWAIAFPLWIDGGLANPIAGVLLPVMMFAPLVATVATVFLVQAPRPASIPEYLGLWPLRPLARTIWMTVGAIFGSILVVVLGALLAAALGLVTLDLVEFSGFAQQLTTLGVETPPVPIQLLVALQLIAIPIGALANGVAAFGEEIGWRGWLLPSLQPLGNWSALIVSGVIWGLWHSPIILLGYNFGLTDASGLALMVGGCTLFGILLGWTRLRTGSVWPAVFGHGAFNAAAGFLSLVIAAGSPAPLPLVSPLGAVTWIVMALVIVALAATGQFRRLPCRDGRVLRPGAS
ncbi:CPBP family intramembrane glutamic endopeptidase [Agromyces sp. NPDC058104]|uniref:CPBP family intramembrane glutamic endopeptidase n=1 Tax=Agromyces sp. NPDC058104 TaxID=3346342 RepID=UPI0036DAA8AD